MKHIWSVLSEKTIVDERDNNISLINVIEKFTTKIDPEDFKKALESDKDITLNFKADLATLWQKSDENDTEEGLYKVKWLDPSRDEIASFPEREIKIGKDFDRTRTILQFGNLPFDELRSGTYYFEIHYKPKEEDSFDKKSEIPLEVKVEKS